MENNELKEIFDKFLDSNHERNNYFHNENSYRYFNANYPDCILIEVEKGGSSGGNCWNDDPSEPYEKDSYEIEQEIVIELKYRIANLMEDLNVDIKSKDYQRNSFATVYKMNEVNEKHINEYYGNYRTEAIYAIKIKDLLEDLLTTEEKEVLEESLHNFILEKKPELLEEEKTNKRKFK